MKKWFKGLNTPDEIKIHYRKLAIEFHPDKGGDTAVMQDINNEYHKALKSCDAKTYNNYTYKYNHTVEDAIVETIKKVITLSGVVVEICGYWLWVSGNTIQHKDYLKKCKLRYSHKKKAWYFHTMKFYSKKSKSWSMNKIRNVWGSNVISSNGSNSTDKDEKDKKPNQLQAG